MAERRLWHLGGEGFDFFEKRLMVLNAEAVEEKDDAAGSGDREEQPSVERESIDSCL